MMSDNFIEFRQSKKIGYQRNIWFPNKYVAIQQVGPSALLLQINSSTNINKTKLFNTAASFENILKNKPIVTLFN